MPDGAKPAKLANILQSGEQALGRVLARARELEALTATVRSALPEPESGHVVAVSQTAQDLVVTVDTPAWAARMRFSEALLIRAAGAEGKRLVVRVRQPPAL